MGAVSDALLPTLALSVRQPWAWAIIHDRKDVENRTAFSVSKGNMRPATICIHAGKGMTQDEYADGVETMAQIGVTCPPAAELVRGGIIGVVDVTAIVKASPSPWFFGPRGLVLRNARPCAFVAAAGALGYFPWRPSGGEAEPALPWMLRSRAPAVASARAPESDLFG